MSVRMSVQIVAVSRWCVREQAVEDHREMALIASEESSKSASCWPPSLKGGSCSELQEVSSDSREGGGSGGGRGMSVVVFGVGVSNVGVGMDDFRDDWEEGEGRGGLAQGAT